LHLDVQKVTHPDGASTLNIIEAAYSLESVYRAPDARRTYHILPLEQFENDTTVVKGKASHDMIIQFRDDSRSLYSQYNMNVPERKVNVSLSRNH
jgi:hypothetical protein